MTRLQHVWDELTVTRELDDGFVRLRLDEVQGCAAYAARSLSSGLEALILEVDTESLRHGEAYADARGALLRAEALTPGRRGRTRLILQLTDGQYRDVFRALGEDIVAKLADCTTQPEATQTLVNRFSQWQRFLREFGTRGLSREQRIGLLGELILLNEHLLERCTPAEAIAAWKGCFGANHDFQFSGGAVEVKTSASTSPHSFGVSSLAQLDIADGAVLIVYFLHVNEEESGQLSLRGLVDTIRSKLAVSALTLFEECLAAAGYHDLQRELYEVPSYSIRGRRFFQVRDGFPRLGLLDVPDGVQDVEYHVAIAACAPFEVPESDVWGYLAPLSGAEGS